MMLDIERENAGCSKEAEQGNTTSAVLRYKQGITDEQYCFELALLA